MNHKAPIIVHGVSTMKSITIHGLDERLSKKISEKARREGLSLNRTIKNLLEEALGLTSRKKKDHRDDFVDFLGVWSEEDVKTFESAIQDLSSIDPKDWQ